MPVILRTEEEYAAWLNPEIVERGPLEELIRPLADGCYWFGRECNCASPLVAIRRRHDRAKGVAQVAVLGLRIPL
jgi:hypothetical protein